MLSLAYLIVYPAECICNLICFFLYLTVHVLVGVVTMLKVIRQTDAIR